MSPRHSIDFCPICGGGLCGIRICCEPESNGENETLPRGLIVCDECEAVWLEPDTSSEHLYLDAINPTCPMCQKSFWENSHWANTKEVEALGWMQAVNRELDMNVDEGLA